MKFFRHSNGFFTLLAGLGLVLVGLITGCAGGSDGGGATQTGTVAVLLTDAPSQDFSNVYVTVNEVSLLSDERGPVTIFRGSRQVDLLALEEVEDLFMIHESVPAGTYNKIRLFVSDPQFVKLDGTIIISSNIDLVAGGKIDLVPRGPFQVSTGETLSVRLDLDVEKSIMPHPTSSDKYLLRPVVFVEILNDLSKQLVRVSGEIVEINLDTQSFLLRRTDPHFNDLGNGDEDRPHLVRVVVPDGAHIFDASGLPDHFIGSFDSLQVGQHVHVRGLLSIEDGLHIEARLIEIGDQFTRRHGLITFTNTIDKSFKLSPDGCQDVTCEIGVQVYDETLIFEAGTHNLLGLDTLTAGKRVVVEGVLDALQNQKLFHAAVIAVKPDLISREGIVGDLDSEARTFSLTSSPPCADAQPPCLLPVQVILVHVMPDAVIIRVSSVQDDHLRIEPIPFDSLMDGDKALVLGYFDELGTPFHALEVITFTTQPIP